jgi:nitrate/TMAO reductase-like tetraheme cytochrome c subunit
MKRPIEVRPMPNACKGVILSPKKRMLDTMTNMRFMRLPIVWVTGDTIVRMAIEIKDCIKCVNPLRIYNDIRYRPGGLERKGIMSCMSQRGTVKTKETVYE